MGVSAKVARQRLQDLFARLRQELDPALLP
jgi:septum formation topological specificity factor MinE